MQKDEIESLVMLRDMVNSIDNEFSSLDKTVLDKALTMLINKNKSDSIEEIEPEYMQVDLDVIRRRQEAENEEVKRIVNKLKKLNAASNYGASDCGVAQLFADLYPIHRYNSTAKDFYMFDGRKWVPDREGLLAKHDLKILCSALQIYAKETELEGYTKSIGRLNSNNKRRSVLADVKDNAAFATDQLDRNDYLLNVQNGTLDLSGEEPVLLPYTPDMLLSKICRAEYNPDADGAEWRKFISDVMMGDIEKSKYLQKIAGMALTGNVSEEKVFILYGPSTRNGKSTFCETLMYLENNYAVSMRPESLAQKKNVDSRQASGDIARLAGCRYCNIAEAPKRMPLDAGLVKNLTGRDGITARHLNEREFTFVPKLTMIMNTNHLPLISDDTVFSSGRIVVVEFLRHFDTDEQDVTLKERLCQPESLSGILNWCLEGWMLYKKEGLNLPQSVIAATEQYREDSDKLGAFMQECLVKAPGVNTAGKDVYTAYTRWCQDAGYGCENKNNFFSELKNKGIFKVSGTVGGKTVRNVVAGYIIRSEWAPADPKLLPSPGKDQVIDEPSPWSRPTTTPFDSKSAPKSASAGKQMRLKL